MMRTAGQFKPHDSASNGGINAECSAARGKRVTVDA
jgi:hypothetical protein